eukprot:1547706-Lingulodinium_polyedra.AAC.1
MDHEGFQPLARFTLVCGFTAGEAHGKHAAEVMGPGGIVHRYLQQTRCVSHAPLAKRCSFLLDLNTLRYIGLVVDIGALEG